MSRRHRRRVLVLVCAAAAAFAHPAFGQQTLNLSVGYVMVRQDRSEADILLVEHHDLAFEFRDFNGMRVGGEFLVPVGEKYEAGAGVSFSRRTVSTVHSRVANADGSPIPRTLGLRQAPIAVTFRVLPLGQAYRVQPYAGGGLALVRWHFSESGDFAARGNLFRGEQYATSGTAFGPVILLGLRLVGERLVLGIEGRDQRARGRFGPAFARVRDADLDLHGWTLNGTIGMRLGAPP